MDWSLFGPWLVGLVVFLVSLREYQAIRRDGWARDDERSSADALTSLQADYTDLLVHDMMLGSLLRRHAPAVSVPPLPERRNARQARPRQTRLRDNRQLLYDSLSEEDIRNSAFDLGLDLNGGIGRGTLLRKLIEYLEKRGQEEALVAWLARCRPDIKLR